MISFSGGRSGLLVVFASALLCPTVFAQTGEPTGTIIYQSNAQAVPTPETSPTPKKKSWLKDKVDDFVDRLQPGAKLAYGKSISSKTRRRFGEGGWGLRPTVFRLGIPRSRKEFGPDFNFDRRKRDGNKLTMLALGAAYRHNFNYLDVPERISDKDAARKYPLEAYPYLGGGLYLFGAKVRVPDENIDTDFKLGLAARLTAGYQYKARLRLEATLDAMTSVGGYNFSGGSIGLNYKL